MDHGKPIAQSEWGWAKDPALSKIVNCFIKDSGFGGDYVMALAVRRVKIFAHWEMIDRARWSGRVAVMARRAANSGWLSWYHLGSAAALKFHIGLGVVIGTPCRWVKTEEEGEGC